MITQKELQDAIVQSLAAPNPNANTCIKLAAFYILMDHIKFDTKEHYTSGSEFMQAIADKDTSHVYCIMDGLMTTLQAVNPNLYDATIEKLK